MSNEAVTSLEQAFIDADLGMAEVVASWFSLPLSEMSPEEVEQMVMLHLRSAYLAGRIQGQADIMPVVHAHYEEVERILGVE